MIDSALVSRIGRWTVFALFAATGLGEGVSQAAVGVLCAAAALRLYNDRTFIPQRTTTRLFIAFVVLCVLSMLASRYGFPRSSGHALV